MKELIFVMVGVIVAGVGAGIGDPILMIIGGTTAITGIVMATHE